MLSYVYFYSPHTCASQVSSAGKSATSTSEKVWPRKKSPGLAARMFSIFCSRSMVCKRCFAPHNERISSSGMSACVVFITSSALARAVGGSRGTWDTASSSDNKQFSQPCTNLSPKTSSGSGAFSEASATTSWNSTPFSSSARRTRRQPGETKPASRLKMTSMLISLPAPTKEAAADAAADVGSSDFAFLAKTRRFSRGSRENRSSCSRSLHVRFVLQEEISATLGRQNLKYLGVEIMIIACAELNLFGAETHTDYYTFILQLILRCGNHNGH